MKQKHIDVYEIVNHFRIYPNIPATFDGQLPSEIITKNDKRILIGETYNFNDVGENGIVGEVTTAMVIASEKKMVFSVKTAQGSYILSRTMSESEISDYKSHPEAFFGVIQPHPQGKKDAYSFFESLVEAHKNYPREGLLAQMKNSQDIEILRKLTDEDLRLEYCERIVLSVLARNEQRKVNISLEDTL